MDLDTALLALRVFAGLLIAGHGAQKALGWSGGPGLAGWTAGVQKMGFRPHAFWARAAAWGELGGGALLALGLLTGIAAGVLAVDMVVAAWKVHWPKGLWIANGGYEYALTNIVVYTLVGLAGPGAFALDASLRIAGWTTPLFLVILAVALATVWAGTRPAASALERAAEEEARRRGHAA